MNHLNTLETGKVESVSEGPHSWDEVRDELLASPVQYLIADEDPDDPRLRVEGCNVIGDPLASKGDLREGGDVTIAGGDGKGYPGVREGADNIRVGIVDFDAVDDRLCLDEVGNLGRRREVVPEGAIVDADG